jgi:predicted lipid-binding transport protein (Tim44 family)
VHFYRLQASWDRRNLEDLSEFTTPEVFAELRTQLAEQAGSTQPNEVVTLEAELLGIDEGLSDWLASVRFSGEMREDGAHAAEPFQEIWNLSKRKDGRSGWLLAGIQQVH